MRVLFLILFCIPVWAQTFTFTEYLGTHHYQQIIKFPYTSRLLKSASNVTGPNGQQVAWEQDSTNNVLVQGNLPSGTPEITYNCTFATGNNIPISGGEAPFFPTQLYPGQIYQINYATSSPTGITNHGYYYNLTYDNNTGYTTWEATLGGGTVTLSSAGSGACTLVRVGFIVDPSAEIFSSPGHNFVNGDPLAVKAASGCPGGLTCDGVATFYVGNATTNTFKLYTTYAAAIAGTSPIDITSAGTGAPRIIVSWGWTVNSGASSGLLPTCPVTLSKNGNNWQLENCLTGVRSPTTAGNGSPFNLSPIQGNKLADGTWIATGPNYLYEVDSADPGSLITATQQTPAYNITAYDSRIVESSPMRITILQRYTTNRPNYVYSTTVNIPSGTGYFYSKITMEANQPVIYYEDGYDTRMQYFVNVYPGLTDKPDILRWRGSGASTFACGQLGGSTYAGLNTVWNTPAYRDLDYTQDVQAGSTCTGTTYKKLNPFVEFGATDDAWYQMMYKASGSSSSPLIGIFAGRTDAIVTPSGTGAALVSSPGPFTTNIFFPTSAIGGGWQISNGVWTGATNPVRTWAQYISTKANLAADGTQPIGIQQPIQRTMNLISGINLTDIYGFATSYSDPVGGWKSPYMPDASLTAIRARVRDGSSFCGTPTCYYDRLPTTNPIIAMWKANSVAGVDTALNQVRNRLNYLGFIMTQGNGAARDSGSGLPFNNSSLVWTPYGVLQTLIFIDDNATAGQITETKQHMGFLAGLHLSNAFIPLDNSAGINLGTSNQAVQAGELRVAFTAWLPSHPLMTPARKNLAKATTIAQLASVTNATGAFKETVWYHGAAHEPVVSNLLALNTIGQYSFADAPQLGLNARAGMAAATPPEPRFSADMRKFLSIGDGNTFSGSWLGLIGTALNGVQTLLAQNAVWLWDKMNSPSKLTHDVGAVPTFAQIDDTVPKTDPALGSSAFAGWASNHRHEWETAYETSATFVNGDFYSSHRHCDQGQVSLYALAAPLSIDWNPNLYGPQVPGCFYHNVVTLDADIGQAYNADNPPYDAGGLANSFVTSALTEFNNFPDVTRSVATFTAADNTVWTRTLITAAPNSAYPIIDIKDSFTGTRASDAKTFSLNLMADPGSSISTPAGSTTPTSRLTGVCTGGVFASNEGGGTPVVHNLGSGLQHFGPYTGALWPAYATKWGISGQGIDWDLLTLSSVTSQQYFHGAWGHKCHNSREMDEFLATNGRAFDERQYVFRLHGTGTFRVTVLPYRKGETPTRTPTSPGGTDLQIVQGSETTNKTDTEFKYTNGTVKILASFDTASHTAFNITLSGAPSSIRMNSATPGVWTLSSKTAGTAGVDLSSVGGTWCADIPVMNPSLNKFSLYFPGADYPPVSVNFSTSCGARKPVSRTFVHPTAISVRWRLGSAINFAGSGTFATDADGQRRATVTVLSPVGSQASSWEYLDGSGNVIGTSGPGTIVVQ